MSLIPLDDAKVRFQTTRNALLQLKAILTTDEQRSAARELHREMWQDAKYVAAAYDVPVTELSGGHDKDDDGTPP